MPTSALATTPFIIIGAGGLGCPVLLGLVAAGAKRFTLFDHDRVEASNLQRQVLYRPADVGARKVEAARRNLLRRVSDLHFDLRPEKLDENALDALIAASEPETVILECTDAPRLKFAVNDCALAHGRAAVLGGVLDWRGQVMAIEAGAPCFRCIYEQPPPPELTPGCSTTGVLGAAAGIVGHWMAMIAVQLAEGAPSVAGRLFAIDFKRGHIHHMEPRPREDCAACQGRSLSSP